MHTNHYLEKLYQDMQLRSYSDHTQNVYGRAVRDFLAFSGKPADELNEQDVRNYILHLMRGALGKSSINTYQSAIRFFFGVTLVQAYLRNEIGISETYLYLCIQFATAAFDLRTEK